MSGNFSIADVNICAANVTSSPKIKAMLEDYARLMARLHVGFGPKFVANRPGVVEHVLKTEPEGGHWRCLACGEMAFSDLASDKIKHKGDCVWADMHRRSEGR